SSRAGASTRASPTSSSSPTPSSRSPRPSPTRRRHFPTTASRSRGWSARSAGDREEPHGPRLTAMKRRLIWIASIVLAPGLLTGGYLYTQGFGSRPAFRTATVTRGPLTAAVSATGTLNAVITVQVGSQVSGQIKELFADFNSQVQKDQVIARIDP